MNESQFLTDLVTFTEEMLKRKRHFLWSNTSLERYNRNMIICYRNVITIVTIPFAYSKWNKFLTANSKLAQSHFFGTPFDEDSVTHLEMCTSLKWNHGKLRCTRLLPFTYSSFHWSYCYHSFGNYCHRSSVCGKEKIFFWPYNPISSVSGLLYTQSKRSNSILHGNNHCVKSVQIRSYFWSAFFCIVCGLNTGKCGPEITPYLDTFHAVNVV